MLLRKRCPHTGVVNYYEASEPHLAIGSVTQCGTSAAGDGYTWRFYGADKARAGRTADADTAEVKLQAVVVRARREISSLSL